jgi:hypothetical protein
MSKLARLAGAVLAVSIVYVSGCGEGGRGFLLDVRIGHVHVVATTCGA